MSFRMVIELDNPAEAHAVRQALEMYRARLHASIERTRRRLQEFEQQYDVSTVDFLLTMTAEDLPGGDMEYVEWVGEAKLLEGMEQELRALEHARYQLP